MPSDTCNCKIIFSVLSSTVKSKPALFNASCLYFFFLFFFFFLGSRLVHIVFYSPLSLSLLLIFFSQSKTLFFYKGAKNPVSNLKLSYYFNINPILKIKNNNKKRKSMCYIVYIFSVLSFLVKLGLECTKSISFSLVILTNN